ncbi:hypothetical protein MD484_g376, partial [Candolleomyces efflorescens]
MASGSADIDVFRANMSGFSELSQDDGSHALRGAETSSLEPQVDLPTEQAGDDDDDEEFVYPGVQADQTEASSGDLPLLQRLFKNATETNNVQPFSLANDAASRTGFTVLHAAASRGYLEIVKWLVDHCGAMPDVEDREGETALHKAALNGHIEVLKYLLPDKADVHARDADGWTALHNAASKGYLDIVMWLCENAGAAAIHDGASGVDIRSNDGWTPLSKH